MPLEFGGSSVYPVLCVSAKKSPSYFAIFACLALASGLATIVAAQTPVVTNPTSNQTIVQPTGTALGVQGNTSVAGQLAIPESTGGVLSIGLNRFASAVPTQLQIDENTNTIAGLWISNGSTSNNARSVALFVSPSSESSYPGFGVLDGGARSSGFLFRPNTPGAIINFNMQATGTTTNATALHIEPNGYIGVNTVTPGASLEVNGNMRLTSGSGSSITFSDGTVQSTAWNGTTCATGGDYAESVDVTGAKQNYEPGDVIQIDPQNPSNLILAGKPYSKFVAGVYSTKPGYVGRRQSTSKPKDAEIPKAMVGILPVKVTTANGPIEPGDLLVSSATPGYAMKATDPVKGFGAVIGKAMGYLSAGAGKIEALISLQ